VSQEKRQRLMDLLVADSVVILQNQKYFVVDVRQVIDQSRQDCPRVDEGAFLNQVNRCLPHLFARSLQGVTRIEDKSRGLVIVRIDREPRDRISGLLQCLQPSRD
jgi:hypothetical protein